MAFIIQLPRQPMAGDEIEICGKVHESLQVFSLNLTHKPTYKLIGYHLKVDYEKGKIIHDWRDSKSWQGAFEQDLANYNMGQHDQSEGFRFRFSFKNNSVDVFEEGDNYLTSHEVKIGLKNINYLEVWEDTRQSNGKRIQIEQLTFKFSNKNGSP